MTGTSTISIPGLDGQVLSATTHEWATDAIVTDGLAEAAQSRIIEDPNAGKMPVLYISDKHPLARGPRNNRQIIPGKALNGNGSGEFVIISGDGGLPKTMAHIGANRQIDQAYSFEWQRVNGGWTAKSFTASVFKNGKAVAQIRSGGKRAAPKGASPMVVAADDPCWDDVYCDPGDDVTGSGIPGGSWGGGYFYTQTCCQSQLNDYLSAAWAFASATQYAIDNGTILEPWMVMILGGLAATAAMYLVRYNSCFQSSTCAKVITTCPWQTPTVQCWAQFKVPDPGFFKVADPFRPSVVPA